MAGEPLITVVGNLTAEPELRFTPSGAAVANFTIASTPQSYNKTTNEWEDGETLFLNCSVWRQAAENVAETLTKGMRVIAQGYLKSRSYDTKDGDRRTVTECEVQEIGPSMKYATARVQKTSRQNGGAQSNGQPQSSGGGFGGAPQGQQAPAPAADPWARSPQATGGGAPF